MSRKRANGEGCISKEKSGRYRVSISVWVNGQRVRRTKTAWKHADALAHLENLRSEASSGLLHIKGLTVQKHLHEWLDKIITKKKKRTENTIESYRLAVDNHIVPRLGSMLLKQLTTEDIETWVSELSDDGVGSRTIENAFKILRSGLKWASLTKRVVTDPIAGVSKPSHEPEEIFPFTIEESRKIVTESEGTRWHAMIYLGLTTGMRTGELLGLQPEKIDWTNHTILVDQQATEIKGVRKLAKPKTKASCRTVRITPEAAAVILAHQAILMKEGLAGAGILFPNTLGSIESRANFRQRVWLPLLKKVGIESRGFHHTRHTYATLSLAAGDDIAVVSKQLGHSKISITYDLYHHVMPDQQAKAVQTMSRLFA